MAKDQVCGMEVDENKAAKVLYKGKTYCFCSPTCQWAFEANPKQFVKKEVVYNEK
ncbi:MAG: YHS domain-containing protein [Candidatus Nanoarchaeia archaeon]